VRAGERAAVLADAALIGEAFLLGQPGDVELYVEVTLDQRRQLVRAPVSRLPFIRRERLDHALIHQLPAAGLDTALLLVIPGVCAHG
jgi:hypothetical protein